MKPSGGVFDLASITERIAQKEQQTLEPGFWQNQKVSQSVMTEIKMLKNRVETWSSLIKQIQNLEEILTLALDENETSLESEIASTYNSIKDSFEKALTLELLTGEADKSSAYVSIHAGSGGTEACDWASMLFRMYSRWAERRGFSVEIIDMLEAEGGIKSVTMQIDGVYAYGYLKSESGVHRLVRISPFDANARRHTSFASVSVLPVLDDTIEVIIKPEDIRIDTYRAGGAGGQKVNKTDSAVRITHIPTNIVVTCQNERSQYKNKDVAMSVLKSRLYELYQKEKEKENAKFVGEKKENAWGSQIRSYVFQPYTLVKDHRTKYSSGNIQAVMDGDIDGFIEAYLHFMWKGGTASINESDEDIPDED